MDFSHHQSRVQSPVLDSLFSHTLCEPPLRGDTQFYYILPPCNICRIINLVGWAGAASHASSLLTQLTMHAGNILNAK